MVRNTCRGSYTLMCTHNSAGTLWGDTRASNHRESRIGKLCCRDLCDLCLCVTEQKSVWSE